MTATIEAPPTRRYLFGIAVPYNQATTLWDDASRGVITETFDERSWRNIDVGGEFVPLLIHHDSARPIGRVTRARHSPDGLRIEARLAASPDELAGIAERVDSKVQSGLSIGAICNTAADVWTRASATGLPKVRRRDAVLIEVSLCVWPAYSSAEVLELRTSTIGSPELVAAEVEALERRHAARRLDDRLARIGVVPGPCQLRR